MITRVHSCLLRLLIMTFRSLDYVRWKGLSNFLSSGYFYFPLPTTQLFWMNGRMLVFIVSMDVHQDGDRHLQLCLPTFMSLCETWIIAGPWTTIVLCRKSFIIDSTYVIIVKIKQTFLFILLVFSRVPNDCARMSRHPSWKVATSRELKIFKFQFISRPIKAIKIWPV